MISQGHKLRNDLIYNANVLIPTIENVHEAKEYAGETDQWLFGASAAGDNASIVESNLQKAEQAAQHFRETIDELMRLEPEYKTVYQQLLPLFEDQYKTGAAMVETFISEGPEAGSALVPAFEEKISAMHVKLDSVLDMLDKKIAEDIEHELADIELNNKLVYIFFICFLTILGLLMIVGQRRIVSPARYLSKELQTIAKGDFSRIIKKRHSDEFGDISDAAGAIVKQLGESLREITSAGMRVSAYAHALAYSTDDVRKQSAKQAEGTGTVVDAIDELTALGQTVAVEASQASGVSAEVKIQAQNGDKLLERSLGSSLQLAKRMNDAKGTVNELAESSNKINEVMAVIQGIAEQTNLLALNAAIEAARAGEQGRGFAVVADEVRTLASRTQESASQIETMIQNLQERARSTVDLITQNQEQASENAEASKQAIEALRKIFTSINELDQMSQNINAATETQAGRYQDVIDVTSESKELARLLTSNSEQSDRFSKALSSQAKSFSELAAKLKVF